MADKEIALCGRVVTPFQVIENGMVSVADGRIAYVGERDSGRLAQSSQVYDFSTQGQYIMPGFIDIHCHGGGGVWSYDDPKKFADFHLQRGTTSILPTLIYNQTHREIIDALRKILAVTKQGKSSIAGIHLEGPYINPKYGAITSPIRPVDPVEYREILALAGEQIKLWTLAPELANQQQFMEEASEYGITFSVGHSEAAPETIFAAVRLGMKIGCHLTNASGATPNETRYDGTREVGVHEAVLVHDDMYAEVIPDQFGIHVRPLMLRLIVKAKGADKVIIITDGMDQAGMNPDQDVNMMKANEHTPGEIAKDMLSGSLLTMDRAVYNMMRHTGIGWVEAAKMASLNPARALGIDHDLGSIEAGKKANFVVVSDSLQVKQVMLEGEVVH